MLVSATTGPVLAFLSSRGSGRIVLAEFPSGPSLSFSDTKGKTGLELSLRADGPSIRLSGTGEAVLGNTSLEAARAGVVEDRPTSSLVLFNKAGKVIWSAP